jgi:diguanylate cyclase (GGDEF)-like protein
VAKNDPRLNLVVLPVCAAGTIAVAAAFASLAISPPAALAVAGAVAMLVASALAERFPVPLDHLDANGVSLGFVFSVAAVLLFGWAAAVVVVALAPLAMQLRGRRPTTRVAYNSAVHALAASAGAAAAAPIGSRPAVALMAAATLCAAAQYAVNIGLVSVAAALASRRPLRDVVRRNVASTALPFGLMGSAALMLVVLWQRSPLFAVALLGPLAAITLYQRSHHRELQALKLALTDPLTGLGNHRDFHERLLRELATADRRGTPLTLCLVDIDDFKQINDRFGHPVGDNVLALVATQLRRDGEAFRLGGDEFAVVLAGCHGEDALAAAESILTRISLLEIEQRTPIRASAGLATFPLQATTRDDLVRLADAALYWAKEHGKNRARLHRPESQTAVEQPAGRAAHYAAAESLARAVDDRDVYTGSHSARVGSLAERVARRLDVPEEDAALVGLAGRLHDIGKLAIPSEVLRKSRSLTDAERVVVERHAQIGSRMLESLGADPLAQWVRHHHERWDGGGYPDGLAGTEIPLGSRIIFVADAYDAMTSDRPYAPRLDHASALAELDAGADRQFDPDVVAALADELAPAHDAAPALLAIA